jgi:tRNA G18 (ribose-2'-O)-methylase SpoU
MGALDYIAWEHAPSTAAAVETIKRQGSAIVCLEVTDVSRPYHEVRYPAPVCLVVGNEALGVSREVLELADEIVEIPMLGFKNSVNVAVAFGIVAFEVVRQHGRKKS